jgi:hypothetical protein
VNILTDNAEDNTEPSRKKITEGVTTIPEGSTHKRVEVRGNLERGLRDSLNYMETYSGS